MILLRHGESAFNVVYRKSRADPGIEDPPLTETGHAQARAAAETVAGMGARRVITSPYTRALETATIVAERLAAPIAVTALVGERCAWSCDIGAPVSALAARWPALDFSAVAERWWNGPEESRADLAARGARFHAAMRDDPDHAATVVITHWGFIRALTGLELANGASVRLRLGAALEVVSGPHP